MVPSLDWFIYAFVRKEAVVSSQIEGTEATLDDLLTFEATPEGTKPGADVEEVCNSLDALSWARRELARPKGLRSVALLESLGILQETTGRKRDRTYRYAGYLDRLRVGTELVAPGRRGSR